MFSIILLASALANPFPVGDAVSYEQLLINDLQQCYNNNNRDYAEEECGKLLMKAKDMRIGIIFLNMQED